MLFVGINLTINHEWFQKWPTLVSQIVDHIKTSEHFTKFAEKLIAEHLIYISYIYCNK